MTLCDEMAKATATLPLALGGMGLRSAERSRVAPHFAGWADALTMIQERPSYGRVDRRISVGRFRVPMFGGSPCGSTGV